MRTVVSGGIFRIYHLKLSATLNGAHVGDLPLDLSSGPLEGPHLHIASDARHDTVTRNHWRGVMLVQNHQNHQGSGRAGQPGSWV